MAKAWGVPPIVSTALGFVILAATCGVAVGQPARTQDIQLTLSDTTAVSGQPVTVTLTNSSSAGIATFDHKSLCSIFFIQKQSGNEWNNVLQCNLRLRTAPVMILAGASTSLTFNGSPHFPDRGALKPGVYRVELVYKQVDYLEDLVSDEIPWYTVHSPIFTITHNRKPTWLSLVFR
jgi:hypothetical protein